MSTNECLDKLRFRLSDEGGTLRFAAFAIAGALECAATEAALRDYLIDRPLADVDLNYLRSLSCAEDGACVRAVIKEVQKYQHLFVQHQRDQTVTC